MAKCTVTELADCIRNIGLEGSVVGVHSNVSKVGPVERSPLSDAEKERGLRPMAKTIINGFVEGLGPDGTLFVPTHSGHYVGGYMPEQLRKTTREGPDGKKQRVLTDDGFYRPETSLSTVGALTQAVIWDDRSVRSMHPTHSTAAIGAEAGYLTGGHAPHTEPVGIQNAFAKAVGLDGYILFIGDILESNTSLHAYETLLLPRLGEYFGGTGAAEVDGVRRFFNFTWSPTLHRDFYSQPSRPTKAIEEMKKSGLMKTGRFGQAEVYYFKAKDMAAYFAREVFPVKPDILFCDSADTCGIEFTCDCGRQVLRKRYAAGEGWDSGKIRADMDPQFLALMEPGFHRVPENG